MNPLLPLITFLQLFLSPVVSGLGCRDWRNREACTAVLSRTWPLVEVVGYTGPDAEIHQRLLRVRTIGGLRRPQLAHHARIAGLIFSRAKWSADELTALRLLLEPGEPQWSLPWSPEGSRDALKSEGVRLALGRIGRQWNLVWPSDVLFTDLKDAHLAFCQGALNSLRWRLRGIPDWEYSEGEYPARAMEEAWARSKKLGWR